MSIIIPQELHEKIAAERVNGDLAKKGLVILPLRDDPKNKVMKTGTDAACGKNPPGHGR